EPEVREQIMQLVKKGGSPAAPAAPAPPPVAVPPPPRVIKNLPAGSRAHSAAQRQETTRTAPAAPGASPAATTGGTPVSVSPSTTRAPVPVQPAPQPPVAPPVAQHEPPAPVLATPAPPTVTPAATPVTPTPPAPPVPWNSPRGSGRPRRDSRLVRRQRRRLPSRLGQGLLPTPRRPVPCATSRVPGRVQARATRADRATRGVVASVARRVLLAVEL